MLMAIKPQHICVNKVNQTQYLELNLWISAEESLLVLKIDASRQCAALFDRL